MLAGFTDAFCDSWFRWRTLELAEVYGQGLGMEQFGWKLTLLVGQFLFQQFPVPPPQDKELMQLFCHSRHCIQHQQLICQASIFSLPCFVHQYPSTSPHEHVLSTYHHLHFLPISFPPTHICLWGWAFFQKQPHMVSFHQQPVFRSSSSTKWCDMQLHPKEILGDH